MVNRMLRAAKSRRFMRGSLIMILCTALIITMMPLPWVSSLSYAAGNREEQGPYTASTTDYGIRNDLVTGVRVDLNANTTVIEEYRNLGVLLLREQVSSSYKYYLVGRGGEVVHSWETGSASKAPELFVFQYPHPEMETEEVKCFERSYPHHLFGVKDPATGKYDVFNPDTGIYYEHQADRLESYGTYKAGAYPVAFKDNLRTLLTAEGDMAYDVCYTDIQLFTQLGDVCYFIAETQSGKNVLLSSNGMVQTDEYDGIELATEANALHEFEEGILNAYVYFYNGGKYRLFNLVSGEFLADGQTFDEINYAGSQVFYGNNDSQYVVMTDTYWYDAATKFGGQRSYVHGNPAGRGNLTVEVTYTDEYGEYQSHETYNVDRYGEKILAGETVIDFVGNYYLSDPENDSGYLLKEIETGNVIRERVYRPSRGIGYAGSFALLGDFNDYMEPESFFWFDMNTGEIILNHVNTGYYTGFEENGRRNYILVQGWRKRGADRCLQRRILRLSL